MKTFLPSCLKPDSPPLGFTTNLNVCARGNNGSLMLPRSLTSELLGSATEPISEIPLKHCGGPGGISWMRYLVSAWLKTTMSPSGNISSLKKKKNRTISVFRPWNKKVSPFWMQPVKLRFSTTSLARFSPKMKVKTVGVVWWGWWWWGRALKRMPHASPQRSRASRSAGKASWSARRCTGRYTKQSSANNLTCEVTTLGRSFMWIKNSKGPRTVPWETLDNILAGLEYFPSTSTDYDLVFKKEAVHLNRRPCIP